MTHPQSKAFLALALGLATAPAALAADGLVSPGDLAQRTGPSARPLPIPPYATPAPAPTAPAIAAPASPPIAAPGRGFTLTAVDVRPYGPAAAHPHMARARRDFRTRTDAGQTPRLDLKPGEAMDEVWVKRQFVINGLIGAPATADRVVALVLRINEAFVQNGYINTGVRFGERDWPSADGRLDLVLVRGVVVPALAGNRGVGVAWRDAPLRGKAHSPILRLAETVQDLGGEKGSGGLKPSFVRQRMPSTGQSPLNTQTLEEDFRRLSDHPGLRTVNAQLTPGDRPGEARVLMTVQPQDRMDMWSTVASSRSPSIGGIRYSGGASIRNLAFSGDMLSVEGGETDGLADGTIDYSTPFLRPGATLGVRANIDQASVLAESVAALGIRSSETSVEVRLDQRLIDQPLTPLPGGRGWKAAQSLTVGLRFVTRHAESSLLGQPFSFSPGSVAGVTDMNVLRGEMDYVLRGERQVFAVSTVASFGVSGSGSDVPGVIAPDPNFKVILVQLNYARRLTAGLEFKASLAAQAASGPLYSAEQFSAGGADTVRGYRQNLLLADDGVRGTMELDCPLAFGKKLCAATGDDWRTVRLSVFSDAATVLNLEGAPQPKPSSIASLGLGLSWKPAPGVQTDVSYGALRAHAPRTGALDLQDRGFQFNVTVHPMPLLVGRR